MQGIINKARENIADRIVEIIWMSIKAAVVTTIILVLLQIIPIRIHTDVDQIGYWDVRADVDQTGTWDVDVDQSGGSWIIDQR